MFNMENIYYTGMATICQCNIHDGGRWTDNDRSAVTYDTARRFAQFVSSVNCDESAYPPISAIGMQELLSETDRIIIEEYLQQYTGTAWKSERTAQGINNTSGIGMFWRPDILESRPEWNLGEKILARIDNGYVIKFMGRLFRRREIDEAFGLFTGKLIWSSAMLNGRKVTEAERVREAVLLKDWILHGDGYSPGMSFYPEVVRVIATDLNTGVRSPTWMEMNASFADPSNQHTHNSFAPDNALDLLGKRYDYIWWNYDGHDKTLGGFADGPRRSGHIGSDHRCVYATVRIH